jgi:hypothetical protein
MLHGFRLRRGATIAVTTATVLAAVGGVSVATGAIPGTGGTIDACYDGTGSLKVIDKAAGQACSTKTKPLSWNQQGVKGDTGPQGPKARPADERAGCWRVAVCLLPTQRRGDCARLLHRRSCDHLQQRR